MLNEVNTFEPPQTLDQIFEHIEVSVVKMKTHDLKNLVVQASKTFEHHKMRAYSAAASLLAEQNDWNEGIP